MARAFTNPICREHSNGSSHPERPQRWDACIEALEAAGIVAETLEPADPDEVLVAHSRRHLDHVVETAARADFLDSDTRVDATALQAALAGIACAKMAAATALEGELSIVVTRPPGHHALADITAGASWTSARPSSGFCIFNTAAVAALHGQDLGAARVAVADFDAHHGNGTQDIFWNRADCAYTSVHQWPFYPGTGSGSETGTHNQIRNFCVPAGTDDAGFLEAVEGMRDFLNGFRPDLLVLSAGFDAHMNDPLCALGVTDDGFFEVARRLSDIAPTVVVLEGGYDLDALHNGLGRTIEGLIG